MSVEVKSWPLELKSEFIPVMRKDLGAGNEKRKYKLWAKK